MMFKRCFRIIFLLCLMVVVSQPAKAEDIRALVDKLSMAEMNRMVELSDHMGAFQEQAVKDFTKLPEIFSPQNPEILNAVFSSEMSKAAPLIWSSFFNASQIYMGNVLSSRAAVGFYNPVADSWLMTYWNMTEDDPVLVDALALPGEYFRKAKVDADKAIGWTTVAEKTGRIVSSLITATRMTTSAFEAKYLPDTYVDAKVPTGINRLAMGDIVEKRLTALLLSLASVSYNDNNAASVRKLFDALETASVRGIKALSANLDEEKIPYYDLFEIPKHARSDLQPVMFIPSSENSGLLLFTPQRAGGVIGTAQYAGEKTDGEWNLTHVRFTALN